MQLRSKQRGISLGGLMVGAVLFIALAMVGMKLLPSYIEFFAIKKAVVALANEKRGATVTEIRKAFDARTSVDDITTITGSDLEITKEGAELVINANYRKEVPLFGGAGIYIQFFASSKG